jgi:hypothetical protein
MTLGQAMARLELAAGASMVFATPAWARAHPVSIHGNGWVAIFLILFAVAVIYVLIIGSLQAEERDGRLGRHDGGEHGWFGTSGHHHKGSDQSDDAN